MGLLLINIDNYFFYFYYLLIILIVRDKVMIYIDYIIIFVYNFYNYEE